MTPSRGGNRRFRPLTDWRAFDYVLAAVGLIFTVAGGWGIAIAVDQGAEMLQLASDCGASACEKSGLVTSHWRAFAPAGGTYRAGSKVDICFVSLAFSGVAKEAAIPGPACGALADGGHVVARLWRGEVMDVHVGGVDYVTYLNPETGFFVGLFRMLGLLPALVCFAVVHFDLANHHVTVRFRHAVRRRLFRRLPSSAPN